jgi:hypothetical protein
MYMYGESLENIKHLYLYGRVTGLYVHRINNFLMFLSHPCMYGKGNSKVLEGMVELTMRPLFA